MTDQAAIAQGGPQDTCSPDMGNLQETGVASQNHPSTDPLDPPLSQISANLAGLIAGSHNYQPYLPLLKQTCEHVGRAAWRGSNTLLNCCYCNAALLPVECHDA